MDLCFLRNEACRHLFFYEEFGMTEVEVVDAILSYNMSDDLSDDEVRIPIILFVCGSRCYDCSLIIHTIMASRTPVYTVNIGYCYDEAFLVFASGAKRFALNKYSVFSFMGTNLSDAPGWQEIVELRGLTPICKEYAEIEDMHAEEALEHKIVTKVLGNIGELELERQGDE